MKPPSDAVRHTLAKLAEVRASRNASSTSAAPPPYTLSVTRPSGTTVMNVDPSDASDYYYPEEPAPITISIDQSINVTGNDNSIRLPAAGASSPAASTSEIRGSSPAGSLAAVIIASLNRANALRDESGMLRPINIQVNSSVRIDGQNNVVSCGEVPKPKPEHVDSEVGTNTPSKRRADSVRDSSETEQN